MYFLKWSLSESRTGNIVETMPILVLFKRKNVKGSVAFAFWRYYCGNNTEIKGNNSIFAFKSLVKSGFETSRVSTFFCHFQGFLHEKHNKDKRYSAVESKATLRKDPTSFSNTRVQ